MRPTSAGIPAIAPTPVVVTATATAQAYGLAHGVRRTSPNAAIRLLSADATDHAIQATRTARVRPTAEGSAMNPNMNQAHHAAMTPPIKSETQIQEGVCGRASPVRGCVACTGRV